MAILTRLSRIFKADLHAILDRIEEPKALLKQAIREMEEALFEQEKSIKQLTLEQQHLALKQSESEQSLNELTEKLTRCFKNDNDALASPLIRQKLELQKCHKGIIRKRESVETQLTEYQAQLKEHLLIYENTRQKAAIFTEKEQISVNEDSNAYVFESAGSLFSDEEIELELINQKQLWEKQQQDKNGSAQQ